MSCTGSARSCCRSPGSWPYGTCCRSSCSRPARWSAPGTPRSGYPTRTGRSASSWWTGSPTASGARSGRCRASTACWGCCCARPARNGWPTSAPTRASRAAGRRPIPTCPGSSASRSRTAARSWPSSSRPTRSCPRPAPEPTRAGAARTRPATGPAVPPGAGTQFTARDEELLSLFAAHAAIALTNARLSERSRELSVLEERARLAGDLHDAVSQKLFSLRARARAAAVLADRDPARAAAEMEAVAQLGAEAHGRAAGGHRRAGPAGAGRGGPGRVAAPVRGAGRPGPRGRRAVRGRRAAGAGRAAGGGAVPGRPGGAAQRAAARRRRARSRSSCPAARAGSSWR